MRITTLLGGPGHPVDLHRCVTFVTCVADVATGVVP